MTRRLMLPAALLLAPGVGFARRPNAPAGLALKGHDAVAYHLEGWPVRGRAAFTRHWPAPVGASRRLRRWSRPICSPGFVAPELRRRRLLPLGAAVPAGDHGWLPRPAGPARPQALAFQAWVPERIAAEVAASPCGRAAPEGQRRAGCRRPQPQRTVMPPSTTNSVPVTKRASSEAR
jgi:hypothetical protein